MNEQVYEGLPAEQRETIRSALVAAFGSARIVAIKTVMGGASGAFTFEVQVADRRFLLRAWRGRQVRCAIRTSISRCG